MKLVEAQVQKFRNILDSTPVAIQGDVTCLVGKNEAGKSAFLYALNLLNPAHPNVAFSVLDQYPAWLEKKDRREGLKLEDFRPVRGMFEMTDDDTAPLEEKFGTNVLRSRRLILEKNYSGNLSYTFEVDEKAAVKAAISGISLPSAVADSVGECETFEQLSALAQTLSSSEDEEVKQAGTVLQGRLKTALGEKSFKQVIWQLIEARIPKFFYFPRYSTLPYSVKIKELLTADPKTLDENRLTARTLLQLAGAESDYLLNPDYERRKRELENVANALTDDVLKYWTQNPELRVQPDITQVTVAAPAGGQQSVLDELKIRIWDGRHMLSLPFSEHSTGFQWFFSFLAAFSEYERADPPVIILLDEPALGLHARAQRDYLRFIDERLSVRCQVLYTTHSPFMVQPGRLERVRVVEDRGREDGAKVLQDVLTKDPDTLFPLQGALGYDLVQHLFIGKHNLVVEGTADFTYLIVISEYLNAQGRTHLDDRWTVVPVGGADLIPTFVALLGGVHLDLTVLIDSQKAGHQRLAKLAADGYLEGKRLITVGNILGKKTADIEDVFELEDYLKLYNAAFNASLQPSNLSGSDPVVTRITRYLGIDRFDHGVPADVLLRKRDAFLPQFSAKTFEQFEKLFEAINRTLPPASGTTNP